jgi:hypothetical protein
MEENGSEKLLRKATNRCEVSEGRSNMLVDFSALGMHSLDGPAGVPDGLRERGLGSLDVGVDPPELAMFLGQPGTRVGKSS